MLPILGAIMPAVETVVDRLIPDKNAQAEAKVKLATLAAQGELDQMAGQLKINMEEAKNPSLFVSGWRPAIGWLCGLILANNYIILPYADQIPGFDPVQLDGATIMPIVLGMLGIGGARTYEKMKGVARENHK